MGNEKAKGNTTQTNNNVGPNTGQTMNKGAEVPQIRPIEPNKTHFDGAEVPQIVKIKENPKK